MVYKEYDLVLVQGFVLTSQLEGFMPNSLRGAIIITGEQHESIRHHG